MAVQPASNWSVAATRTFNDAIQELAAFSPYIESMLRLTKPYPRPQLYWTLPTSSGITPWITLFRYYTTTKNCNLLGNTNVQFASYKSSIASSYFRWYQSKLLTQVPVFIASSPANEVAESKASVHAPEIVTTIISRAIEIIDDDERLAFLTPEIQMLIRRQGTVAVKAIGDRVLGSDCSGEVGASILRATANVSDEKTKRYRVWLMERGLQSRSPFIRHASIAGLLTLKSTTSIGKLRDALAKESSSDLKSKISKVIKRLGPFSIEPVS